MHNILETDTEGRGDQSEEVGIEKEDDSKDEEDGNEADDQKPIEENLDKNSAGGGGLGLGRNGGGGRPGPVKQLCTTINLSVLPLLICMYSQSYVTINIFLYCQFKSLKYIYFPYYP